MEHRPDADRLPLLQDSDAPQWEHAPEFGRRATLLKALKRLHELHAGPACIVETGTLRDDRPQARDGDGWSTIAFGWYAAQTGGQAYTVDISPDAIETCKRLTADYSTHLHYACADAIAFLREWPKEERGEIHLLYLDSVDYFDRDASERHHLAEAEAALPALAPCCLVLFDDTILESTKVTKGHEGAQRKADGQPVFSGKGARAIPLLLEHGFQLERCEGGQALLSRGASLPEHEVAQHPVEASLTATATVANRIEPITDHKPPTTVEAPLDPTPLCMAPSHFEAVTHSPALSPYLNAILQLCLPGARSCEVAFDTGYPAVWLSGHGMEAEGISTGPRHVERARMANNMLGGRASFRAGDYFDFYRETAPRYHVVHHQGLLHRFTVPYIHSLLAQQVASADWVVFSVPSVYSPAGSGTGDERLLPIEEWQRLLAPFELAELRYYGDPANGSRDYILGVLKGKAFSVERLALSVEDTELSGERSALSTVAGDEALRLLMSVPEEAFPQGISAIVLARNEVRHIAECLQTLRPCSDEIIVCDMESTDDTVEIARRFTDNILFHPLVPNFDSARNAAAMRARFRWILFLDADERIPPKLAHRLRELVLTQSDQFEALTLPFRHHFAGRWMTSLYPGYKAPSLFKNGQFYYNARPHQGARVDGRIAYFPADDLEMAPPHYSYDSLHHYLDKLNRYTDTEADNLSHDGVPFDWRHAIQGFVRDFEANYAGGRASQDGVHGFFWAFMSGFYRFATHAKLYERRFKAQQLSDAETTIPSSLEEMLEYALAVAKGQGVRRWALGVREMPAGTVERAPEPETQPHVIAQPPAPRISTPNTQRLTPGMEVVWTGPLTDPSGYGEECRNFLFALQEAGVTVAGESIPWSKDEAALTDEERQRLEGLIRTPVAPGFIQVVQNFPPAFQRHPQAGLCIGRTMFETDRLPLDWVQACNRMDAIWVPSEFNRRTFALAGVQPDKLAVIPGCFDPAPFLEPSSIEAQFGSPLSADLRALQEAGTFVFLSVFDWTQHKGWDVLLRGFLEAFEGREDVTLVLKVWSTQGYSHEQIREQAIRFVRHDLDHDLLADRRIRFVEDYLSAEDLRALYRSADAFVLPSRGEGWGRPYMEAMASGLPTIGTNWSGNTAFMTQENSYLLDYELVAVPEVGWRELPPYRGHRWAEPSLPHLKETLHRVTEERAEAQAIGQRAQEEVCARFSRAAVAPLIIQEIARLQEHLEGKRKERVARLALSVQNKEESVERLALSVQDLTSEANGEEESDGRLTPTDAPTTAGKEATRKSKSKSKGKKAAPAPDSSSAPAPTVTTQRPTPNAQRLLPVRFEGARFRWHSLAHVNRELCLGLLHTGQVELSVVPTEPEEFGPKMDPRFRALEERAFAPLSAPASVHVRHHFPPRFDRPYEGALVLMQPWEYGFAPKDWIAPILQNVDELWCYSNFVKQVYLASGIPEEMLAVVPLGVDADIFTPEAPPYVFTTEPGTGRSVKRLALSVKNSAQGSVERLTFSSKHDTLGTEERTSGVFGAASGLTLNAQRLTLNASPFTFLFVGGTIYRKGIDVLIDAYLSAFSAYDGVLLVIKDTGNKTVYQGQCARERILALCNDPTRPPVVYLDDDLPPHQLAGLYTAADCLVQPYRGEGFCLPALEAMACGVPVVVPEGGATDDFVDECVGWRIAAERRPMGGTAIGPFECVGNPWMLEVAREDLACLLRHIVQNPDEAKRRGQAGMARVREGWTWRHAADVAIQRTQALSDKAEALSVERRALRGEEEALSVECQAVRTNERTLDAFEAASASTLNTQRSTLNASALSLDVQHSTLLPQRPTPNAQRPLVSLCMIVRNEERVLEACLSSARPYFDEIIVVDTGSTDRTVDIAERHGAKVHFFPWCDDFSAARNASMAPATGEWIFWMDADDTLPPQTGETIRQAVLHAPDEVVGFVIPVQFIEDGIPAGGTRVDHVKLFRNRPGLRWEGRIHEQIYLSLCQAGGQVTRLDVVVLHSGYDTSPEGQARKLVRDDRLLDLDLQDQPTNPFRLYNRGMTDHSRGNHEAAVEWLRRSLQLSGPGGSHMRWAYALLAVSLRQLGRLDEAMATLEEGLAAVPDDPELHFQSGYLLSGKKEYTQAKEHYLRCLQADTSGYFSCVDMGILSYKTHRNLARLCLLLGSYEEAREWWLKALEAAPTDLTSAFDLLDAAVAAGDQETVARMLEIVRNAEGWRELGEEGDSPR